MLNRMVESWQLKESRHDQLVPGSLSRAANKRRLRVLATARLLIALAFVALAFVLFAATRLNVAAQLFAFALLGALVTGSMVMAAMALGPLARAERESREAVDGFEHGASTKLRQPPD